MVRTSRSTLGTTASTTTSAAASSSTTAAAVAAAAAANMDDIDLDVMFAEDGDELFEGLDIDYDMDDIGGSGGGSSSAMTPPSTAVTTAMNPTSSSTSSNTNQRRGVLSRPPPSSPDNDDSIEEDFTANSRTRRKTKRKTKAPSFFADDDDDDDDDYNETVQPSTKNNKRRKAGANTSSSSNTSTSRINTASIAASVAAIMKKKATTTNSKGGQQQQQMRIDDSSTISTTTTKSTAAPTTTSKSKSKSIKTSNGMPPPLARNGPWIPTTSNASTTNNNNNNKSNNNNNNSVAHSGQFGNRQKRPGGTSFPALPKSAISSSSSSSTTSTGINASSSNQSGGRVINKLPLARSVSESSMGKNKMSSTQQQQQQQQQRLSRLIIQPENTYCGLQPSSTHFYPFMPSLPSEPALKSRKVYGTIDRIHTSLVGYIHTPPTTITSGRVTAKESDPIFQLLQEAFKEEKAAGNNTERLDSIGIAIAELRHSISTMDKNRIITDWYGVCALVQRQHDFLKQNCDNMERWCRDHFSKEDFDDAFVPPSKRRKDADNNNTSTSTVAAVSILKTFRRREIKVRISFTGLKDPKNSGLIPAIFPPLFLTNEVPPTVEKEVKPIPTSKKKSQTTSDIANGPDGRGTELSSPSATKIKPLQQPLSYVNMKPPRRRRNVAEMITRTARELAKSQTQRMEVSKKNSDRRESDLQKLVSQDMMNGIHTAGMWKYIEVSGYFHEITESEISDRLGGLRSFQLSGDDKNRMKQKIEEQQSYVDLSLLGDNAKDNIVANSTVFDRLQSLLIDVDDGDDDDDFDNNKEYLDKANTSLHELIQAEDFIDVAQLTLDERSLIQLGCFGVISNTITNATNGDSTIKNTHYQDALGYTDTKQQLNGSKQNRISKGHDADEIDDIISAMKSELQQVETLNDERLAFLETISNNYRLSRKDDHQRSEREASLIAKCQQLIRKTKDLKAKSGATMRKDDSLALPW